MNLVRCASIAILALTLVTVSTLHAGEKKKPVLPDSVSIYTEDIDTLYRVAGVVGSLKIGAQTEKMTADMYNDIRKSASIKGAEAIIFADIVTPDLSKAGVSSAMLAQIGGVSLAVGVAVELLDSAQYADWEAKHPRKEFDGNAEVEVAEKDLERLYTVKGVAYGCTTFGTRDLEAVDSSLREYASKKRCNGVIFTEYSDDGWTGWGVMVKYKKPRK
jgi:hypothetical protein